MYESRTSPPKRAVGTLASAALAVVLIVVTLLAPVSVTPVSAQVDGDRPIIGAAGVGTDVERTRFTGAAAGVDVAEDGTRFVFDETGPRLPNELPDYGNGFVTQGYIYPKGTLDGSNGVLADGSPEFPELVIGHWTCWGYFIGDGADTVDAPWVITTQLFDFDVDEPGRESIVTVGMETPAGAGEIARAVTGGTGRLRFVRGQMVQETIGHNASEGVNATFDFDMIGVRRATPSPSFRTVIR